MCIDLELIAKAIVETNSGKQSYYLQLDDGRYISCLNNMVKSKRSAMSVVDPDLAVHYSKVFNRRVTAVLRPARKALS